MKALVCLVALFVVYMAPPRATPGQDSRRTRRTDSGGMILISGGCFAFGPSERACATPHEERVVERMCLPSFWIDRAEVTTDQYEKCVDAAVCAAAGNPGLPAQMKETGAGYPVVRVGWKDAAKYCKWVNKRLPRDEEWERTARGPTMSCYPWGNAPPNAKRVTQHRCEELSFALRKVCTKPAGATAEGVCDMADNAREYVDGWWDMNAKTMGKGQGDGEDASNVYRIVRGGTPGIEYRGWDRQFVLAKDIDEKSQLAEGFRCARDAKLDEIQGMSHP